MLICAILFGFWWMMVQNLKGSLNTGLVSFSSTALGLLVGSLISDHVLVVSLGAFLGGFAYEWLSKSSLLRSSEFKIRRVFWAVGHIAGVLMIACGMILNEDLRNSLGDSSQSLNLVMFCISLYLVGLGGFLGFVEYHLVKILTVIALGASAVLTLNLWILMAIGFGFSGFVSIFFFERKHQRISQYFNRSWGKTI